MRDLELSVGHLRLKPCTVDALIKCKVGWPQNVRRACVHMDGSFLEVAVTAAWAFVVILEDEFDNLWYARHQSGVVSDDQAYGDLLCGTWHHRTLREFMR